MIIEYNPPLENKWNLPYPYHFTYRLAYIEGWDAKLAGRNRDFCPYPFSIKNPDKKRYWYMIGFYDAYQQLLFSRQLENLNDSH